MAISLSDLTGASTSGNVLNEVNSYADFLDSVPRFVNKADPTGATDAVQTTATKQPVALPLIDGEGYLFCSGVTNNYASVPSESSFDGLTDFVIEARGVTFKDWSLSGNQVMIARWDTGGLCFILRRTGQQINFFSNLGGVTKNFYMDHDLSGMVTADVKVTRSTSNLTIELNTGSGYYQIGTTVSVGTDAMDSGTSQIEFGARYDGDLDILNGAIKGGRIWDNATQTGDPVLDVDFTSPRIPHGASEFLSDSGHQVRVITSGNNPSKVIKKPVLRFDGSDDGFKGFFENTISEGYMFAAFSVLGNGGETSARVFSINSTGDADYNNTGSILSAIKGLNLSRYAPGVTWDTLHAGMSDDDNGDILHEIKIQSNAQLSRVNNADEATRTTSITAVNAEEFNIGDGSPSTTTSNASIDLEYLAVFPATLSDSQADQIRNYINNRNKVFYRWDTDGYYFFDPQKVDFVGDFTSVNTLDGYITGSDKGDTDVRSNLTLEQAGIQEAQPYADGYKITFNDNAEYLNFTNGASQSLAGWQIVGTSLGTFAYKVNSDAITELNLLGNAGLNTSYRKTGDLYGIILLPENATNRDIEEARKLLIDRGAADGVTEADLYTFWYSRKDIREFKHVDTSSVTDFRYAWKNCSSLQSFPLLDTTNATGFEQAFYNATSLSSFPAIQAPNCSNFIETWRNCSSLTQFAQDAKLGTEASNVYFNNAWRESGLTSFSTPLPTAISVYAAWYDIPELTDFNIESLPLVTDIRYAWYNNRYSSFSTKLPKANLLVSAWLGCSSLTDFSADVFANWNPTSLLSGVFNNTWDGCTSLTAQSVENILVPIAASGKWATYTGLEGGTALTDATIDIDYDVTTGSLTAATLTAIETLNGRGWSVNINGVIQ